MKKITRAFHGLDCRPKRLLPLMTLGCSILASSLALAAGDAPGAGDGGKVTPAPVVPAPPPTPQELVAILSFDLSLPDRSRLRGRDVGALVAAGFWPDRTVPVPTAATVPLPGDLPPFGERDSSDFTAPFPEDVDTTSELEP